MAAIAQCSSVRAAAQAPACSARAQAVSRPAPFAGLRRASVVDKDLEACPVQQVGARRPASPSLVAERLPLACAAGAPAGAFPALEMRSQTMRCTILPLQLRLRSAARPAAARRTAARAVTVMSAYVAPKKVTNTPGARVRQPGLTADRQQAECTVLCHQLPPEHRRVLATSHARGC